VTQSQDIALQVCPYCKSPKVLYSFCIEGNEIRRCNTCDLIYRDSPISKTRILSYYRKHYYQQWGQDQKGPYRDDIYLDILSHIEGLGKKGNLLDIGAGNGQFLALAQEHGWKIQGQEISSESCQVAMEKYGILLRNATLKEMKWEQNHYDLITMVNVLDHLPDPWWVLENAFQALKKRGLIYVRIPNGHLHSILYRIVDAIPIAFLKTKLSKLLVMHLYHLTPQFITSLLRAKGFRSVIINNSKSSKVSTYPSFNKLDNLCLLMLKKSFPAIVNMAYKISKGRVTLSPSIYIYAVKP